MDTLGSFACLPESNSEFRPLKPTEKLLHPSRVEGLINIYFLTVFCEKKEYISCCKVAAAFQSPVNLVSEKKGSTTRTLALSRGNIHTKSFYIGTFSKWVCDQQKTIMSLKFGANEITPPTHRDALWFRTSYLRPVLRSVGTYQLSKCFFFFHHTSDFFLWTYCNPFILTVSSATYKLFNHMYVWY